MNEVKAPAINPTLVRLGEHARNVYVVEIPPGVSLVNLQRPDYWAHCGGKFKAYDRIECRAQDNAWFADLLVRKVEKQSVQVWVLSYVDLRAQIQPAVPTDAADYVVSFGGPKHLWRIVRQSDKSVVHHGEANQSDADAWLAKYLAGESVA